MKTIDNTTATLSRRRIIKAAGTVVAGFASDKRYVVETSTKVVERCLLTARDGDIGTRLGECVDDRPADSAAAAGDDCDLARKAEVAHERSSLGVT